MLQGKNQPGNIIDRDPEHVFAIAPPFQFDLLTRLVQTLLLRNTFFEPNLEVFQNVRSFLMRKGMQMERKKYLETSIGTYLENGFSQKLFRNPPPNHIDFKLEKRGKPPNGYMHFNGLHEYIEYYTRVEALSFDRLCTSDSHPLHELCPLHCRSVWPGRSTRSNSGSSRSAKPVGLS